MIRATRTSIRTIIAAGIVSLAVPALRGQDIDPSAEAMGDANRTIDVHILPAFDEEGEPILGRPADIFPLSMRQSCQDCHDYDVIRTGLHFGYAEAGATSQPRRPGEPWIWVDEAAGTVLPIHHQPRQPNVFTPAEVGLSDFDFVARFGRHLPGGGVGEYDSATGELHRRTGRWRPAGRLEINCMLCHDGSRLQDHSEYARQVQLQNFRWGPTAAMHLGVVDGAAGLMSETYDVFMEFEPEGAQPRVTYDPSRFDPNGRVFFDVLAKPSANRCYACHTVAPAEGEQWAEDQDAHIAAGLSCADCHRNGLDHDMVTGAPGPAGANRATLTCEGCHLGAGDQPIELPGRLTAPRPEHRGLPTVHFDKLTCTACHSGPWPEVEPIAVQTSRAHALGVRSVEHMPDMAPTVTEPIFAAGVDGRIGPHRAVWPSFFARLGADGVQPLSPDQLRAIATVEFGPGAVAGRMDEAKAGRVLAELAEREPGTRWVYLTGGRLLQRAGEALVDVAENLPKALTRPVLWPMAHNIRPAERSMGARGCTDCHSRESPLFFGRVPAHAVAAIAPAEPLAMAELMEVDPALHEVWGRTFGLRGLTKLLLTAAGAVLAMVILANALRGTDKILRLWATKRR